MIVVAEKTFHRRVKAPSFDSEAKSGELSECTERAEAKIIK